MPDALRVGVAGCGRRGMEHAEALDGAAGLRLVGIADPVAASREGAARARSVPAYATLDELLDRERPDVLVVATPPVTRAAAVEPALAAGCRAVVVEKPMAPTLAEAERILAAADAAGALLVVGHQLRFVPALRELRAIVEDGELGELRHIRAEAYGTIGDQGPHMVDAIRWLAGGPAVRWVMAQRGDALAGPGGEPGDPAWLAAHLELDGGLRASVECGRLHRARGDATDPWLDKRLTVVGERGMAECSATAGGSVLTTRGRRAIAGGLPEYLGATRRLHEALAEALRGGGAHPTDGHDAIESLQATLACARSAVEGDALRLPLHARAGVAGTAEPEISIVLPLTDHRGHAERAVAAWTAAQTLGRDRFELIVASDGAEPGVEAAVRPLLGPGDRLLRGEGLPEIALYDLGARAARGRWLLFSEPHCAAEPRCLEELLAHLQRTGEDGACLRSAGVSPTPLARMEERLFEEGFADWSRDGHWSKVIVRGFALHRDAYREAGGFPARYGRFGEHALALALARTGRRIGYAPGACVRHANTTTFAGLEPPVVDHAHGEARYRAEHPEQDLAPYLGTPAEWADRHVLHEHAARRVASVAAAALRSRPRRTAPEAAFGWLDAACAWVATAGRLLPAALGGAGGAVAAARASAKLAEARCLLLRFDEERMFAAYKDAYARLARQGRIAYLAAHPAARAALDPVRRLAIAELPGDRLLGFHGAERAAGTDFRWSGPVAILDLAFPPGVRAVRLLTGGLRGGPILPLIAFLDGRRLPRGAVTQAVDTIVVDLGAEVPAGEHALAIACRPLRPSRHGVDDRRLLGVPVVAVELSY